MSPIQRAISLTWLPFLGLLICGPLAPDARADDPPQGVPRGYKIIEGDIIVPDSPNQATYAGNLWPDGIVHYEFDPDVAPINRTRTFDAMDEWEACANVLFIERTTEANYVYIQNSNQNSSFVGRVGGKQNLNMVSWGSKYVIVHELGHALGLWHEQSRTDRDTYVQINYENIQSGKEHNFNIRPASGNFGPYDFDSVMHYGQYAFSINGNPTITVLPPYESWQDDIGQRNHLSVGDCDGMAFLYNSPTILVPADQPTIQAAIDAAPAGFNNEIIVDPGTYNEVINFNGKIINLRSIDSSDPAVVAATVIDGTGLNDTVVKCVNGETSETILDGFTITGGNAVNGGGMLIDSANPQIMNCRFTNNTAAVNGGAIHNTNAQPNINNCQFDNNSAGVGGALYNDASHPFIIYATFDANDATLDGGAVANLNANPTIYFSEFNANAAGASGGAMFNDGASPTLLSADVIANTAANGAGVYNTNGAAPTFTQSRFIANAAGIDAGAMLNLNSDPILVNCLFNGNTAGNDAGAILNNNADPNITNALFSGNAADNNGGAIANTSGGNPTWINCSFTNNTAVTAGGGVHNDGASPTLTNTILWNNTDAGGTDESAQFHLVAGAPVVNHCNVQGGWTGAPGAGNLNANPLFINPLGPDTIAGTEDDDLRLFGGSPSIDAGDNAVVTETEDFDGNDRIRNGVVDMGPFESFFIPADRDVDGDVDGVDFAKFASCYNKAGNPPRTLGCSPADQVALDMDDDGDIDGIDFSVFAACFNGAGNPPRTAGGGAFQCQFN